MSLAVFSPIESIFFGKKKKLRKGKMTWTACIF